VLHLLRNSPQAYEIISQARRFCRVFRLQVLSDIANIDFAVTLSDNHENQSDHYRRHRMVGEGVLHECLLSPDVEQVLVITRKPSA